MMNWIWFLGEPIFRGEMAVSGRCVDVCWLRWWNGVVQPAFVGEEVGCRCWMEGKPNVPKKNLCIWIYIYIYYYYMCIYVNVYTIRILNIYRQDAWLYYTTYMYHFSDISLMLVATGGVFSRRWIPSASTRSTKWLVILQFMWSFFVVCCRDFVKVMYPLKKDECETSLPKK